MLVVVPPISFGAFLYGKYLKQLSNDTQEALGDMSKVANEALFAVRTVQAFTAVPHEQKQFRHRVNHVRGLVIKEARASAAFFGASGWAGEVVELGLLVYGGALVSHGQISVGDLMSLIIYAAYIDGSLNTFS
ncbi:ATP-binding cassette permease mdl1 [Ceratobasidium sp. 428]|nr:ATP-binding cassette permease mdl1 [Ceratobasidium sp. 428]